MATQSTTILPGLAVTTPDIEHGASMKPPLLPRPSSLVRQTAVLLQSGDIVKAKIRFPSQDQMDTHTLQEMIARWRERSLLIEQTLTKQRLSGDDIFILHGEWTMLVRRMNAAQTLLDLLHPMEV